MESLGRLVTAMVTPFDSNGAVDYEQAGRLAKALYESGSEGVVVSGTTGESPTLTKEEKLRLFAEIKRAVGKGVIAGTGTYSTRESIELTREAEEIGVDAVLLVVPYYNKPTQHGLYEHYKAIAASTKLPCILYNVPGRTGTNLAAETVIKLSGINNIVGVKEASGNLEQVSRIIQEVPRDFLVYSGNDGDTLPILALGGYGVISVASHLVGKQIARMMDLFLAGQTSAAAEIHRNILPLISALFAVANPIPVKYAVNHVGFAAGKPRLPLTEADEKTRSLIDSTLKTYCIDIPPHYLKK